MPAEQVHRAGHVGFKESFDGIDGFRRRGAAGSQHIQQARRKLIFDDAHGFQPELFLQIRQGIVVVAFDIDEAVLQPCLAV